MLPLVGWTTVITTDLLSVPPTPVQLRVYVPSVVTLLIVRLPLVGKLPVQAPLAVQESEFVEAHVKVTLAPLVTVEADAEKESITAAGDATGAGAETLLPAPAVSL